MTEQTFRRLDPNNPLDAKYYPEAETGAILSRQDTSGGTVLSTVVNPDHPKHGEVLEQVENQESEGGE